MQPCAGGRGPVCTEPTKEVKEDGETPPRTTPRRGGAWGCMGRAAPSERGPPSGRATRCTPGAAAGCRRRAATTDAVAVPREGSGPARAETPKGAPGAAGEESPVARASGGRARSVGSEPGVDMVEYPPPSQRNRDER